MINLCATSDLRSKRWFMRVFALLILLALCIQLTHVHADDFSNSICLACVSAHSTVPVAAIVVPAFLVAITFVIVWGESEPPTFDALLEHFIRPPPGR